MHSPSFDHYASLGAGSNLANSVLANTYAVDSNGMAIDVINVSYGVDIVDPTSTKKVFKQILHNVSFNLSPGSLCALMGPSGSGKSTLLDLLSSRTMVGKWSGDILFNGGSRSPSFSRDSAYILQDDLHISTLTVRETIYFAASCRLPEGSSQDVINKRVDELLEIVGLVGVQNSLIGDSTTKGISGGQLKRLSIAVEIVALPKTIFLDEPTSGLDSTIALDVMSAVRRLADQHRTCISTIHQPSTSVFSLFDTLVLLAQGRLIYFGPAKDVVQYFTRPELDYIYTAGQNPAEFIVEIGEGILQPPGKQSSPRWLAEIYDRSPWNQLKNGVGVNSDRSSAVSNSAEVDKSIKTSYRLHATAKHTQFKLLMWRNSISIIRDVNAMKAVFAKSIIVGSLIGIIFFRQGRTTTPMFSPTGIPYAEVTNISALIFFGMMYSMVSNIEAIPFLFARNLIFRREIASFTYSVSPYWLAHCLCIIPLLFLGFFVFTAINYVLVDFPQNGGYFFYYIGVTFMADLSTYYLAMLLGAVMKSETSALTIFPIFFVFLSTFTGYPILISNIPKAWAWAAVINYTRWGYEGLMVNQWGYFDEGQTVLELYSFDGYHKVYSFYILLGVIAFMLIAVYVAMLPRPSKLVKVNKFDDGKDKEISAGDVSNPLNSTTTTTTLNQSLLLESHQEEGGREEPDSLRPVVDQIDLSLSQNFAKLTGYRVVFRNIVYKVSASTAGNSSRSLTLLRGVSGIALPGEICALMGASGAGKTTLLDILADRKTIGELSGDILLNGRPLTSSLRRNTAYVMQDNVLMGCLTVKETLSFAARLRLPESLSVDAKTQRVTDILAMLGLSHVANSFVGSEGQRGISGGQKKRVSIGVEIIHLPDIIFLDEPTTGLDSAISHEVMTAVRGLANQNRTVICTIHQPSPNTYALFDKLLLLSAGRVIYYGGAAAAVPYFAYSPYGFSYLAGSNPAEYVIAVASGTFEAKSGEKISADELADYFEQNSPLKELLSQENPPQGSVGSTNSRQSVLWGEEDSELYSTSQLHQLWVLMHRQVIKRSRDYGPTLENIAKYIFIGLFYGSIFFDLSSGMSTSAYLNRLSILFFSLLFVVMGHQADIPAYIDERPLFNRERAANAYSTLSYWASHMLVSLPINAFCILLYSPLVFFLCGLRPPFASFVYFVYILFVTDIIGLFVGHIVASIAPTVEVAMIIMPIMLFFAMAFEGFIIYIPQFPDWLQWATYASYLRYAFQALVLNEFNGNPQLPLESEYINVLGFGLLSKAFCAGMLWIFVAGHGIASYLAIRYINFEKR